MIDTASSGYSQTQGMRILEQVVQAYGPVFTLEQVRLIAADLAIQPEQLGNLISKLAGGGWIEIIKRGVYVVRSPLFAGEISPLAIAAALIQPMAISHWSACAHHGFTTQIPRMVQAVTPQKVVTPEMRTGTAHSPRGRAVWLAYGLEIEFIHIQVDKFWGFSPTWVNSWQQVNITDPERTALDLIARADIFGGMSAAMELLENALPTLRLETLVDYTLRYGVGSVIKRMGWALEQLGAPGAALAPLEDYPVGINYSLDPQHHAIGEKNQRWNIRENLREE